MTKNHHKVRAAYKDLFTEVSAILFRHDPVGINFGFNTDEYDPETGTVIPRLNTARSQAEVLEIVHEEFVNWFGKDTAGERAKYVSAAAEIFLAWQRWEKNNKYPDQNPS